MKKRFKVGVGDGKGGPGGYVLEFAQNEIEGDSIRIKPIVLLRAFEEAGFDDIHPDIIGYNFIEFPLLQESEETYHVTVVPVNFELEEVEPGVYDIKED